MIVIVFGLPGSGKSYFAGRLADQLGAQPLSTDVLRKELFLTPEYTEEEKEKVYNELLRLMKTLSEHNDVVVLDGTFYKAGIRDKFAQGAKEKGEAVRFIEIEADEGTIEERLNEERSDSDADYDVYLKIKEEFEPMQDEHLILHSTDENIDELLEKATSYIDNQKIPSF